MTNEYDLIADDYAKFFDNAEYLEEDRELAEILPFPEGDILDIGCGTGLAFYLLFSKVQSKDPTAFRYYGIDPSGKMLEKFEIKNPNVLTEQTTFEKFQPTEKFDIVVSTYASISYIDPARIGKIKDVLKAGGKFFLMFSKDDYEPITHKMLAKNKVKMSVYKFSEYTPFLRAISEDVTFKEWHNYIIAEGTV